MAQSRTVLSIALLAALVTTGLAGCATDDPTKGGLFGGIGGMAGGSYDKRVKDRKTDLENEEDQRTANQRMLDRTRMEQEAVAAERGKAEAALAALRDDIAVLKVKVGTAQTREISLKARIAKFQTELDKLEREVKLVQQDALAAPEEKQQRLAQLKKSKEALEREIDLALRR